MPTSPNGNRSGLPHRGAKRVILAQHLVLTGYGHWLPNDPRGSGSTEIRRPALDPLGDIHQGRKRIQPPRHELKSFYRQATPLLQHPILWFDAAMRQALAEGIAQTVADRGYTLWALAILSNHAHALLRAHRDHSETIWRNITRASRDALQGMPGIPTDHPIWSSRPYTVLLHTDTEIRQRVCYINDNPKKERLPPQHWPFVAPYPPQRTTRAQVIKA